MRAWGLAGLVLFGVALALAAGEAYLRATGHAWRNDLVPPDEPLMLEPDPVLGWRIKPGRYVVPAYVPGGNSTHVRLLEGGGRYSGPAPKSPRKRVAVIGCSYAHGWGLSDEGTFTWMLQSRYPRDQFTNLGTPGFGTYQSLLALQRSFSGPGPKADLVLYGFVQHHEMRNVADIWWLAVLAQFSRRGHVSLPYCLLGPDGELARHPPEAYFLPALDRRSALIFALRCALTRRRRLERFLQARPVTEKLLAWMDRFCRENKAKLVVVLLEFRPDIKLRYAEFLRTAGVEFIDCAPDQPLGPELRVPGEGHPNALQNARWAECIERGAGKYL